MSPILFDNLFDDIDQIFDSQCNPVIFNSEILNQLLYADDMAFLSLSYPGSEVPERAETAVRRTSEQTERSGPFSLFGLSRISDPGYHFHKKGYKIPLIN